MTSNFFEIQNGNFTASEKNKVDNVNLVIEKQGEIISPCSLIVKFTLFTLFFSLAVKFPFWISRKFSDILRLYYFFIESIYLDESKINIVDQNIRKREGMAAASNKSCEA